LLLASAELGHQGLIQLPEDQIQSTDPAFAAPKESSSYPLLYSIEHHLVGNLNLRRSESVRLGQLISNIDLQNPQKTTESDRGEIRMLLRRAVIDR